MRCYSLVDGRNLAADNEEGSDRFRGRRWLAEPIGSKNPARMGRGVLGGDDRPRLLLADYRELLGGFISGHVRLVAHDDDGLIRWPRFDNLALFVGAAGR